VPHSDSDKSSSSGMSDYDEESDVSVESDEDDELRDLEETAKRNGRQTMVKKARTI